MRVQGDPNNPILTGNILTKSGGKIRFQATSFDLVNGRVTFKKSFVENPFLHLEAQARVPSNVSTHTTTLDSNSSYNSSEEMVDVKLFIQGPATHPTIIPTSEPALGLQIHYIFTHLRFYP